MTQEEKLKQKQELIKQVKRWSSRLKKLRNRKSDPLKESEFCRRHNIEITYFNRMKKLAILPKKEKIETVEAALEAEGV